MILQPMVMPSVHPGNLMFIPHPHPHPPGMQFGAIRGPAPPVPNSFVPMQVTRQSIQQQPRAQQTHLPPVAPPDLSLKNDSKEVQNSRKEPSVPLPSEVESASPAIPSATAGRDQNQERTISSSKPPGSRLAIRFNGP